MSQKKIKVGINGFGRIGRLLLRAGFEQLDFVGINSLGGTDVAAHLLKYDSTQGTWPKDISEDGNSLSLDGKKIPVSSHKNPEEIPWKEWGADIVFECTGAFKKKEEFELHLKAGAKKVIVSAPAPGADQTLVYGINHVHYDPKIHNVISNASCTTNCLAPLVKILHEAYGIEKALMTTVHSYTNDQQILDANHKDLRRARAAALSMVPTTTGAALAVGEVLPDLKGKIDGVSIRVPTPTVSLVDFVFETRSALKKEEINQLFLEKAKTEFKGILRVENAPLVSADFIGERTSSVVDSALTMVMGHNMGKVFAWYDNEMGFSCRMVDMALWMAHKGF